MKVLLRSWRSLLLAWAVVLAPQAALVHALSHDAAGAAGPAAHQDDGGDKRGHSVGQACGTCLAFAQLGALLPSRLESPDGSHGQPLLSDAPAIGASSRHVAAFHARAPPAPLT